jgi:2-oxoglutarate dehydrogenase E1 component
MGAWIFAAERVEGALPGRPALRYAGRPRSASPATGSYKRHLAEQRTLVADAFGEKPAPATAEEGQLPSGVTPTG